MKRRAILILLLLLAGAIVNVAVAWGLAAIASIKLDGRFASNVSPVTAADEPRRNDLITAGWSPTPPTERYIYHLLGGEICDSAIHCSLWIEQADLNPDWRGIHQGFMASRPAILDYAAGWPARSVHGALWNRASLDWTGMASPQWIEANAIVMQGTGNGFDTIPNILPLRPIWPGFAINTVFYAVVLWLLFALGGTPFALRRWRRIKRGLCPKCAYPVGTNQVCTECGAAVAPKAVSE